jgi:hypothetical protein
VNAIDQLIEWYAGCEDQWNKDLWHYSRLGEVHFSSEFVLMARPVCRDWTTEQIINPSIPHLTGEVNTWYIHLAVGDLSRIIPVMPYRLKWAAFQREGRGLRFYNLDRILNRNTFTTQHHGTITTRSTEEATTTNGGNTPKRRS